MTSKGEKGHVPPASVAREAEKGLEYRGMPGGGGGTPVGVARARDLKNREAVSDETIMRMVNFFSRHRKNKAVAPEHRDEPWKDRGYVAWLLWGGDAGNAWANKVAKGIRASRTESTGSTMRKLIESLEESIQLSERKGSPDLARASELVRKHESKRTGIGWNVMPKGSKVTVHLNKNRRPMFSVKYPPTKPGQTMTGAKTVGHVMNAVLSDVDFTVAPTVAGKTATKYKWKVKKDKKAGTQRIVKALGKSPYAGATGTLVGVRLSKPGAESDEGEDFGPKSGGSTQIVFNPANYPRIDSLLFCRIEGDRLVPVKSASKVGLRGWELFASGVKDMSDSEIDSFLRRAKVDRDDVSFSDSDKPSQPSDEDRRRLGVTEGVEFKANRKCLF